MKARTVLAGGFLAGLAGGGVWIGGEAWLAQLAQRTAIEQSVYYEGCNEVRAQGKAPLYRGDPGYGEHMDGDGDGIACEPHW